MIIDPHGIISGFTFMSPHQDQIQAVLDGRVVAIKGDATEAQLDAIFDGKVVRVEAEPHRSPPPPEKPNLPPSDEVHISPTHERGTVSSTAPDHWMRRGFDLRSILAEITNTTPSRIDLPSTLDNEARYDFVFVPPREEDEETIHRQVRSAIEKYFHVTITPTVRSTDVYVMTALEGKTPKPKNPASEFHSGSSTFSTHWKSVELPEGVAPTRKALEEASRQAMATAQLTAMTGLSSSMDDLCRALEDGLHRPIIDETKMTGIYDFKIQGEAETTEQFFTMLRDQLGLVLIPTQRPIELVVVQPTH